MKKYLFFALIAFVACFSSCKNSGTYYCQKATKVGNVTTFEGEVIKKRFISYDAMLNYSEKNSMWCDKK